MQLVLLSGGSGKRLWPLSNESYSKQFLRILPASDGTRESMVQRVVRQIRETGLDANVTIATGESQRDPICSQLGNAVHIVTEPERRDTFPAIALSCLYLEKEQQCGRDEVIVVMPSDPYTDNGYFHTIGQMAEAVKRGKGDLVLMGIRPLYPSTKYGYIVPEDADDASVKPVLRFTEKPDEEKARELIDGGALWNGGVFAFRLGYMLDIIQRFVKAESFSEARSRYAELPKISFDYEVAEKARSVSVVPFDGLWKDLGTWDALSEVLGGRVVGKGLLDETSRNTHIVNQLDTPCICVGAENLIIAASPDGILVADKDSCEHLKPYVERLDDRPMYEERRWGTYKVVDRFASADGNQALTKHLHIKSGKCISYQKHLHRDEVWTFVAGTGTLVIDGGVKQIKAGDVVYIRKGQKHFVEAITDLHIIEVQLGDKVDENDIERYDRREFESPAVQETNAKKVQGFDYPSR